MAELASDLLDDLFNLDSRLWRSVVPLILKPGFLTTEYLAGKRARYLPPFRMYLVFSLSFFALSSLFGDEFELVTDGEEVSLAVSGEPADDAIAPDSAGSEFGCAELADATPIEWREAVSSACTAIAQDSGGFVAAVRNNIPTMMFLLIPIVALIMKLIYPLTQRRYIEHLIFCLHVHALFFLILTLGFSLEVLVRVAPILLRPAEILVAAGTAYLFGYVFVALLRVYRQDKMVTLGKFALLGGGYGVTLFISFLMTVAYTAVRF